ncbi:hypothetical protein CJP72_07600 [Citrobacter sp. NCU1]|uniref:SUMF1/EgtB/PvdO family nonheme iron enzyme n=1 Tax=Citrobacter sp. NCU1 TaxID=2026683 RepID=UPI0013915F2B|nr:hypothetical protein [Citrobacter sp. NCU1]
MRYKFTFAAICILLLSACDNKKTDTKPDSHSPNEQEELRAFITQVKSNLVFVQGGTFWMGDFCKKMRNGGAFCTGGKDNKPAHEVELTSYSISKIKTTNQEYDFYLDYTKQSKKTNSNALLQKDINLMGKYPTHPAHANWDDASKYCHWLATVTNLPFSLPTEAQWEYAARSRGQYRIVATDDNTLRAGKSGRGENIATDYDRQDAEDNEGVNSLFVAFPGDKYPPNPLGVYDMAGNGFEWTNDWYDPDYYSKSPRKDPQGPDKSVVKDDDKGGYMKVLRGKDYSNIGVGGITIDRHQKTNNSDFPLDSTIRCAVNSPLPIK